MANGDWKVGDLVQLKSGGPTMTVVEVAPKGYVHATWFAGAKKESGGFPPEALQVPPEKPGPKAP